MFNWTFEIQRLEHFRLKAGKGYIFIGQHIYKLHSNVMNNGTRFYGAEHFPVRNKDFVGSNHNNNPYFGNFNS